MNKVYMAMLVLREKITSQDYFYHTLGPMIGTLDNDFFINYLSGKKYPKMTNRIMKVTKSDLAYYNLIELEEYRNRFDDIKDLSILIHLYIEFYKGTTYYLHYYEKVGHIVIPVAIKSG